MKPTRWWPLGLLLALPGCNSLLGEDDLCTTHIERALEVRVEDAVTGAPIAAGAVGHARDGAFSETLQVVGWTGSGPDVVATTLGGADERPGVYAVEVVRPGYARWDTTGVRVRKSKCHVEPARMVARLQPLP